LQKLQAMSLAVALTLGGLAAMPARAAEVPQLAKVYAGTLTAATYGLPGTMHPRHPANVGRRKAAKGFVPWSDSSFRLEIVQQVGRSLELRYGTDRLTVPMAGVISADGRMITLKGRQNALLVFLDGDAIQGCGGVNGYAGGFDHYLNNYAAFCIEAKAVR